MILFCTLIHVIGLVSANEVQTDADIHLRSRRALNDDFDSFLYAVGAWSAFTDISIGDKISFNYTIVVPQDGCQGLTTSINTSLVGGENIFSLCSVNVTSIGPNIVNVLPGNVEPILFRSTVTAGSTESYEYDSAFINFGDIVTNAGTNDTILVQFDVIVVNSSVFTVSDVYDVNVTSDFVFNASSESMNRSVTLTAVYRDPVSTTTPTYNLTGLDSLGVGETTNWTLSFRLLNAYSRLTVRASLNGSVTNPTCGISFVSKGGHFMCLEEASYSYSLTGERAQFDIPSAINTGYSTGDTNTPDSEIVLNICVTIPMNLTSDEDMNLNVDVFLDDVLEWKTSRLIVVTANETQANTLLLPNGDWAENNTDVSIGDKLSFLFTVVVPENGCQGLVVSINTSLVGGENIFSLCSVNVTSIGANILTVVPSDFVPVVVRSTVPPSSTLSYKGDSAYIVFGDLTTTASGNDSDYHIVIAFDVIVVNSSTFTPMDVYSVMTRTDVTIDGSPTVWLNDFNVTAVDRDPYSIVPPMFNMTSPSTIGIGDVGNLTVNMNLRDAYSKLSVRAWVNGTYNYPVCSIYFVDKGHHYSCLDEASGYITRTADTVQFDVPTLINTGFGKNSQIDSDNNVVLNVFIRVPPYVIVTDDIYINVEVYVDDKLSWNIHELMTLTVGTAPTTSDVPSFTIGASGGVLEATPGGGAVFVIDVNTPPGSITSYDVTVTSDADKTKICDVKIMNIGINICMDNNVSVSYVTPSNVNIGVGSVPNLFPAADPNDPENEFRLEVLVCVSDTPTVNIGETLTLTADLQYNNGATTIQDSLTYTVVTTPNPILANDSVTFSPSSTVSAYISEVVQLNVTVYFPPTTDVFNVTVDVPISSDNAQALVEEVTLMSAGNGLPCLVNRSLIFLNSMTTSHTQVYMTTYTLGPIINPGFVERSPFESSNDTTASLILQIALKLSDHVLNTQGAVVPITTTLAGSSGVTTATTDYISVQITGVETPSMIMSITMDPFVYTEKRAGDNVTFHVEMALNETSTAHAQNVTLHVMSPYYVTYASVFDVQDAEVTYTPLLPDPGMTFTIGEVDFKDNVTFSFNLTLDPAFTIPPGTRKVDTVLPADITYGNQIRADRTYTGVSYSGLSVFEFGFSTDNASAIGIEDGTVLDCQITASSSRDGYQPSEVRLNTGQGWQPAVRGSPFCGNEYLQIDIGYSAFITGLKLQSSTESAVDIVTSFQLMYSNHNYGGWTYVTDNMDVPVMFDINTPGGGSVISDVYDVTINETSRFTARYIRLVPTVTSCTFGLRMELYGTRQAVTPAPCPAVPGGNAQNMSYIVNMDTGSIFACGLSELGGEVKCSRTDENGAYWQAMDDNVAMVTGLITNTSIVIGQSQDGQYMVSWDDGFSWESVTAAMLAIITGSTGYTSSMVTFPAADYRGDSYNTLYAAHGTDGDTFQLTGSMEGIVINIGGPWSVVAWWGTEDWSIL